MKIITDNIFPPIPIQRLDWMAYTEDHEPGCPIGFGPTEEDAIKDLREKLGTEGV